MFCSHNVLVFETPEMAKAVANLAADGNTVAALSMGSTKTEASAMTALATYWASKLNCAVRTLPIGEAFDIIAQDNVEQIGPYHVEHVKTSDGKSGWICCSNATLPELKNYVQAR